MSTHREVAKAWNQLVASAWKDETVKRRLLEDPAAALREKGIEVPAGVAFHTHENTDREVHLVVPTKPSREVVDLDQPAANGGYFYTIF